MKKYVLNIMLLLLISNSNIFCWELTNDCGKTRINSICYNGKNIYIGLQSTFYTSNDKGLNWIPRNLNLIRNFKYITSLSYVENKVFAGTQNGVFSTSDDGNNWKQNNTGLKTSYVRNISNFGGQLYVLTSTALCKFDTIKGMWNNFENLVGNVFQTFFIFGDTIIVGSEENKKPLPSEPNIFISYDNGNTWNGIIDTTGDFDRQNINCLLMNNGKLFAGTNRGLYISTNNGNNWIRTDSSLFANEIHCLTVFNNDVLVGTKVGLFKSTNNGDSWIVQINNMASYNIICFTQVDSTIFIGTTHGLYKSTNNEKIFELQNNGLAGGNIFDIIFDDEKMYAGTYEEGILISSDYGEIWTGYDNQFRNSSIYRLGAINGNIFAGLYMPGGFWYTSDNGINWKNISASSGLSNTNIGCIKNDDKNIFVGTWSGLFISSDNGLNWNSVNDDINSYSIKDVLVKENEIYVSTLRDGVFSSLDYGKTFSQSVSGLPATAITSLALSKENLIAATYNGFGQVGYGIFLSTDKGLNWSEINDSLTKKNILSIVAFNNFIFAGTDDGIFLTTNFGTNWKDISLGLPTYYIIKILLHQNYIYVATNMGVFKAPLSDFGITEVEDTKIEELNYLKCYPPYPNPTANIVRSLIYWDTSIDIENDDIAVYDIFGNKVAGKEKITIDKQNTYSGLLTWDCSNVPDGIYLIRVIHGTESRTMKVIVSK